MTGKIDQLKTVQIGGDMRGLLPGAEHALSSGGMCLIPNAHGAVPWYYRNIRSRKYRVVTTLERASNRLIRSALSAGFAPRAFALLETTGRRTGLARHTPVGSGLAGDTFWLRVKADGVWRAGTVACCASRR
jgi:hypothetical protein